MPLFSVIIPVYNVEKYLDRCVQSVLTQPFKDLEAILVDDGSTDSSGKKCDVWACLLYTSRELSHGQMLCIFAIVTHQLVMCGIFIISI